MKALILFIALFGLSTFHLFAQVEIRLNAGPNLTLISDFESDLIITEGQSIPGFYHPLNFTESIKNIHTKYNTKPKIGLSANIDLRWELKNEWFYIVNLGINQVNFDYNITVDSIYDSNTQTFQTVNYDLDKLDKNHGDSYYTFVSFSPIGIGKRIYEQKITLIGSIGISGLFNSKYNYFLIDNENPEKLYYKDIDGINKYIIDMHLRIEYAIFKNTNVFVSYKKFYNSELDIKYNTLFHETIPIKPHQIQLGLSYLVFKK
jgi:hypothetical protein